MSRFTAKLLNEYGRVTLHECVRLEIRNKRRRNTLAGRMAGVYPIYQCTETHAERIYGCLTPGSEWQSLFPGVSVEEADDRADRAA